MLGGFSSLFPPQYIIGDQTMMLKLVKHFLNKTFCIVGRNSPYIIDDFVHILLDATEHEDFINNTGIRVGGPTGETVFSRLKNADFDKIKTAFSDCLKSIFPSLKRLLRNRQVALAFDITEEPFYGTVEGLWIHPYCEARGSTGCFKYITVNCTDRVNKIILGSLPIRIGADIVELVREMLTNARKFVKIEIVLFDRGFDDYRLVEMLLEMYIRYQILWKKYKWTKKVFKTMKRGDVREVSRNGKYSRDKSTHKVKLRFVLIKKYRRYSNCKAYNWVFVTNTRCSWAHEYVDKYRKRWNIETTFRVLDDIKIKTTTKKEVIRYFLNVFCCLIYNLWKLSKIFECSYSLKNFVYSIVERFRTVNRSPQGIFEG